MAIHDLGRGAFPGCAWAMDWDDVSQTIGVTATGSARVLQIVVQGTWGTYVGDCIASPPTTKAVVNDAGEEVYALGAILNAGRTVVLGPGSVIGKTAPVTSIAKSVLFTIGARWAA